MKNIIFVISTLQESDSFFTFALGLKDKNKNINIISIFQNCNEMDLKNELIDSF